MRAVLARLLLAIAVVLFQHGAVAHVLMHVGEDVQHHQPDGGHHAPHGCDACHAFHAADGGEPPTVPPFFAADAAAAAATPVRQTAHTRAPSKPFDSQAPPARS